MIRGIKIEELKEKILEVEKAIKPLGVEILSDYSTKITQHFTNVKVKEVTVTLVFTEEK